MSTEERKDPYINEREEANKKTTKMPKKIGQYELVSELGQGGMGRVFKAYERSLDRYVALKVLRSDLAEDEEYARRLIREAQANAKLEHQNVASIYSAGKDKGQLYIAMQYIDGMTLDEYIEKQQGPLPVWSEYALKDRIVTE